MVLHASESALRIAPMPPDWLLSRCAFRVYSSREVHAEAQVGLPSSTRYPLRQPGAPGFWDAKLAVGDFQVVQGRSKGPQCGAVIGVVAVGATCTLACPLSEPKHGPHELHILVAKNGSAVTVTNVEFA